MDEKVSRRDLFQQSAALGVLAVVGAGACSKTPKAPLACSDTSTLSAADAQVRASLAYADVLPGPREDLRRVSAVLCRAPPDACGSVQGPAGSGQPAPAPARRSPPRRCRAGAFHVAIDLDRA